MNRSHRGLDGSLLGNWGVTWTAARGTAGSGSGSGKLRYRYRYRYELGGARGRARNSPNNHADQGSYYGG
jgi:hypothetical protein